MSRSLDLRLKKPLYSPWRRTSRCSPFRPESLGPEIGVSGLSDPGAVSPAREGGVSGQGKTPGKFSRVSLRPHYWEKRYPSKKWPGDLGRSLRS
jgi:hypothetical protein